MVVGEGGNDAGKKYDQILPGWISIISQVASGMGIFYPQERGSSSVATHERNAGIGGMSNAPKWCHFVLLNGTDERKMWGEKLKQIHIHLFNNEINGG